MLVLDSVEHFMKRCVPLAFAGSVFVQTDGMPGPLRAFAGNQLLTSQVVDAVWGFLLDQPVGSEG